MVKSLVSKLSSSSSLASSTSSQHEHHNPKNRNDPGRFFGDGVQFKAKLIGILEVGEARGDRMCQEALQDLKMAIRAAGEHKQRITIHVTIDGLRLRDEKTSDSLYHHPVHKISFIAQDMTDSRAFGYIFGSPDSGHRFFGIKTDKAASQVVLAMRDLFQVVFELKKKEIELARQQIQSKTIHEHQPLTLLSVKHTSASDASSVLSGSSSSKINNLDGAKSSHVKEMSPESVADLVDLEQELSSIQRGITQMERITPSEPTPTGKNLTDEDPFGDSFTNFPTYNLLPPPESSRSRHSKPNKPPDSTITSSSATITSGIPSISNLLSSSTQSSSKQQNQINASSLSSANDSWLNDLDQNDVFDTTKAASIVAGSTTTPIPIPSSTSIMSSPAATAANSQQTPPPLSSSIASSSGGIGSGGIGCGMMGLSNSSPPSSQPSTVAVAAATVTSTSSQNEESQKSGEDYLSTSTNPNKYSTPPNALLTSTNDNIVSISNSTTTSITNNSVLLSNSVTTASATHSQYIDAFSDLDPLGTGRIRPYVDKKYFFQELKNPPKKVLKDLSSAAGPETNFTAQFVSSSDGSNDVLMDDIPAASSTAGEDSAELFQTDRQTNGHPTDPVMLPRDTDPFSPTRKKSDPFQDGDIFGKLDPFEFEFPNSNGAGTGAGSGLLPETKISNVEDQRTGKKDNMFNGPLQVNLPPESGWSTATANSNQLQQQQQQQHRRVERQTSESPTAGSRNRPSVFKQNTVDVISSISSKKMPHLFGQKFSKRDTNSINMRRLQESDSLSENETAPEPPPRPDSVSHSEPPPLPPKKQFSDIVIRPRITPPPSSRYECVSANKGRNASTIQDASVPPIPLPSRRIGRSEGTYPGPGRPRKPGNDEDDYLQPLPAGNVPPLLPPPQTRGRTRRQEIYENKTEAIAEHMAPIASMKLDDDDMMEEASILPDITLSQLLTLGIDELAAKLSVPTSKLSTMTLVELTTYLSEFIEKSKKPKHKPVVIQSTVPPPAPEDSPPIFKVNFDQMPDATFVAKFDDNFGEDEPAPFVANFSQFEVAASSSSPAKMDDTPKAAAIPSADRYAVFREIIDQELHQDSIDQKSSPEADDEAESLNGNIPETNTLAQFSDDDKSPTTVPVPKIDTKITEAISHAKDRYAALRDIILVEDLFEKPPPPQCEDLMQDFPEFSDGFNSNTEDMAAEEDQKSPIESSPESNQNEEEDDRASSKKGSNKFLHTLTVSSTTKDDLEIDELMNRAISNLSLDSREHLSPSSNVAAKSPATLDSNGGSPHAMRRSFLGTTTSSSGVGVGVGLGKSQFNDMSTSPIPLQKSPAPLRKSPLSKSPLSKSPIPPQLIAVSNLIDASKRLNSGSLSDVICGSSPDADTGLSDAAGTKPITGGKSPKSPKESWAVFDKGADMDGGKHRLKSPKVALAQGESPCSSDGKEDWNRAAGEECSKRWPKGQTSSSSRDLSPWDDETSDYKKRIPPTAVGGADRHGYYMRHARRMNSCDEDYEYEEELNKRRERKVKSGISRSRENFEFDSPQWYHTGPHHTWSPQEEEGRARSFDRGAYERTTYGPPVYDKREHKIPPSHLTYDRRDYKGYDKRKYYREYMRPNYDFEPYSESPDTKERKMQQYYGDGSFEKIKPPRRDYENIYEDNFGGGPRSYKSRDYIYERDRKSFDRDSVESYESAGRRRKSFGSGDVYGSLESREEFRERYMGGGPEKTRSLRKGMKMRLPTGSGIVPVDDYDQDSESEVQSRRVAPIDSRSLQRPAQGPQRMRKSSGSSPWDGEEPPPPGHGQKGWKRPSSASESERRLAESRRAMGNTPSGSDGEKDRRFRKKPRSRTGKDLPPTETRSRYSSTHRDNYDYINYDDYDQPTDEDKFERLNRRRHEMHQRMMESERRQKSSTSDKYAYDDEEAAPPRYMSKKEANFYSDKPVVGPQHKNEVFDEPVAIPKPKHPRGTDFDFNDFEDTPRSNTSSKFNFEEHGFESDFNSPPPASCNSASTTTPATKSSFRFSNDFSDKEKHIAGGGSLHSANTFDSEFSPAPALAANSSNSNIIPPTTTTTTTTQKLRFDDRVTISKFDNDQPSIGGSSSIVGCCDDAFEDDFSKAEFDFEKEDQWNPEPPKKNNLRLNSKLQQRQEMIKKSESINIFAKKNEDPFEDDEFFKSPPPPGANGNGGGSGSGSGSGNGNGGGQTKTTNGNGNSGGGAITGKDSSNFQWESNFAKFDENM